jgi:hypothetical protein
MFAPPLSTFTYLILSQGTRFSFSTSDPKWTPVDLPCGSWFAVGIRTGRISCAGNGNLRFT